MKIALCGRNQISSNILSILAKDKKNIIKCFTNNQSQNLNEIFGDFCKESISKGYETFVANNTKNEIRDLFLKIEEFNPDLIISVQFPYIFKKSFIKLFKNKIINLHFGNLPLFRGMSPISQAIINEHHEFGVTIHIVEDGIDTGNILYQNNFNIKDMRNIDIYKMCIEKSTILFNININKILNELLINNSLEKISYEQDDRIATYYSRKDFDYSKNEINFNQKTSVVVKLLRAYYFPPLTIPLVRINNILYKVIDFTILENFNDNNYNLVLNDHKYIIKTLDKAVNLTVESYD